VPHERGDIVGHRLEGQRPVDVGRAALAAWTSASPPAISITHLAIAGRTDPLFADDAVSCLSTGPPPACPAPSTTPAVAAATEGRALVDDACAMKAVVELTKE
jgi:hypothetical protein